MELQLAHQKNKCPTTFIYLKEKDSPCFLNGIKDRILCDRGFITLISQYCTREFQN